MANISLQSTAQPYAFAGREPSMGGQIHMRHRYYNPLFGRFTQADPLGFVDGVNQYAYALNSPANYIDPWGTTATRFTNTLSDVGAYIRSSNYYEPAKEFGLGLLPGYSLYDNYNNPNATVADWAMSIIDVTPVKPFGILADAIKLGNQISDSKAGDFFPKKTGYGPNDPPVRIDGDWSDADIKNALKGRPPKGLGSPDLHHADQMPGSAIHEILPGPHRGNKALHPNKYNQGVTPKMRRQDKQLHWWYRAREQGADQKFPDLIYNNK